MSSRSFARNLKQLANWVAECSSRERNIVEGKGIPGTRAAPTRAGDNDSKIGLRLDNGETLTKDGKEYKRYKLQANPQSKDPAVKKAAQANPHAVIATADVLIGAPNRKGAVKAMFDQLKKQLGGK